MTTPVVYIDPLRTADIVFRFAVTTLEWVSGVTFELVNTGIEGLGAVVSVEDPNHIAIASNQPTEELGDGFYRYALIPGVYTEAGLYVVTANVTVQTPDFDTLTIGLMVSSVVPAGGWLQAGVRYSNVVTPQQMDPGLTSRVWYLPR